MKNLVTFLPFGIISLFIGFTKTTCAQTGVAGVGSSSTNVVWLDAHAMNLSNGAPVTSWIDYSGNNNNFSQVSSQKQPIYSTNILNGMSVITFDGYNDILTSGAISNIETNELTYFIVYKKASLTSQTLINSNYASSSPKWRAYSNANNDKVIAAHYSPTIKHVNYVDSGSPTYLSSHSTGSNHKIYNEGIMMMSKNEPYTAPSGHQDIGLGNIINNPYTNHYCLDGYLAEVVIYNTSLNDLERIFVENYLATKYGLTAPTDLYAYDASHQLELVGIGNDGTNSQTTARGKGVMEFSGADNMSSGEYLLAAHTDFPLSSFTTADIPASLSTHQRWSRTWRAGETGDVGNVDITFYLSGQNFGTSTSYRLLVDDDGNFTNSTIYSGTYDGGQQTVTFNVNLSDGQYFTLAGIEQILVIKSITTGNWSDPNTWDCTCVPGMNDQVYIMPTHTVTVDVNASASYLDVEPSATLLMSSAVNLDIYGDWDIVGDVAFTDGSFSLVGDVAQYVDAGGGSVIFNDIYVNNFNSSTITFYEATYLVNGTLYPQKGSIVMDGGVANQFIINSTSANTGGRIDELLNGSTITGDITVRRFLASGNSDWRNLASPVIGSTFDDWDPDLAMSGPGFPDGCAIDSVGQCYKSVRYHQNSIYYNVLNSSDEIQNTRGYQIWVGDDLYTFSGTTLSSRGTVNTSSDIVKSMNTGWWLVGNPYASPITFNSIEKTSQVQKYYYIYDASTGGYQWYDQVSQTSSVPEITSEGLLSIGQGFWVYVSSAGSMTFKQSDKSSSNATFIRTNEFDESLYLTIKENSSTYSCTIAIQEDPLATDAADSDFDIKHLSTGLEKAPSLGIDVTEEILRKNYIAKDGKNKSFSLYTKILNPGYYTIEPTNIQNFDSYKNVLIFDKETAEMINLKKSPNYTFYSEIFEGNRFMLILSNDDSEEVIDGQTASISDLENGIFITQMGPIVNIECTNEIDGTSTIKFVNVIGQQEVYSTSLHLTNGSNVITLPAGLHGVHILVLQTSEGIITKKLVL